MADQFGKTNSKRQRKNGDKPVAKRQKRNKQPVNDVREEESEV